MLRASYLFSWNIHALRGNKTSDVSRSHKKQQCHFWPQVRITEEGLALTQKPSWSVSTNRTLWPLNQILFMRKFIWSAHTIAFHYLRVSKLLTEEFVFRNTCLTSRFPRKKVTQHQHMYSLGMPSLPMHKVKEVNFSSKWLLVTQFQPQKSQKEHYGTFEHRSQYLLGNIIKRLINRRIILHVYIALFL